MDPSETVLRNAFGAAQQEPHADDPGIVWWPSTIYMVDGMQYVYSWDELPVFLLPLHEIVQKTFSRDILGFELVVHYDNRGSRRQKEFQIRRFAAFLETLADALDDIRTQGIPEHSFFRKMRKLKIRVHILQGPERYGKMMPGTIRAAVEDFYVSYVRHGEAMQAGALPEAPPFDLTYAALIDPEIMDEDTTIVFEVFDMPLVGGTWRHWNEAVDSEVLMGEAHPHMAMDPSPRNVLRSGMLPAVVAPSIFK